MKPFAEKKMLKHNIRLSKSRKLCGKRKKCLCGKGFQCAAFSNLERILALQMRTYQRQRSRSTTAGIEPHRWQYGKHTRSKGQENI